MGVFPEPRPEKFGRYILLDRINVGGMAEVFRGKSSGVEGFERLVALKRILPNIAADQDFIDMFIDEAKLAVQLQHANIAQVYDLGKHDDAYYIAMEYVSGVDLRSMWDRARNRNRLLPIAMSCHIMQKACEGLDAAHRKKDQDGNDISLVHRDVSPQNILISFEGEAKIIDFGIARAANKVSKTQAGVLKGKFGYMSPEQVRGITLDNRSDIFACGVVLYELLVGDRLFLGESDFSTLEKVRNVELVPPTRLNKNLSPHLETDRDEGPREAARGSLPLGERDGGRTCSATCSRRTSPSRGRISSVTCSSTSRRRWTRNGSDWIATRRFTSRTSMILRRRRRCARAPTGTTSPRRCRRTSRTRLGSRRTIGFRRRSTRSRCR